VKSVMKVLQPIQRCNENHINQQLNKKYKLLWKECAGFINSPSVCHKCRQHGKSLPCLLWFHETISWCVCMCIMLWINYGHSEVQAPHFHLNPGRRSKSGNVSVQVFNAVVAQ